MNHKKSFTCDINQFDKFHVKKIYALKNFNSNKKPILDNLIKKNKKYKDIYNLIKRQNNVNNNNSIKGKRVYSEDKLNSNDNEIYSYDTKFDNQTKEEKIKSIYDEIQLLKNINNINNNYIESNNISKKAIFDSLNIELPKTLRTNKSNVNIIENNQNENNKLVNLKQINMSQKNIFNYQNNSIKSIYKNLIPEKKFNEKEIKKWIEQEKNSNRNNEKYYNENNLDIFNSNSLSRNSNLPYFNSLSKSKKNGNSFIYSNNYFENELSIFEFNLNKINNSGFHKLGEKTRNIKNKNKTNLRDKILTPKY